MISIYLIQNIEDGKVYVGKTSLSIEKRWKQHVRDSSKGETRYLYNAFRKYGLDVFKIRQIDEVESQELANQREKYWITQIFHSNRPENGYNQTEGGDGGNTFSGKTHSRETKNKIAKSHTGLITSEETKQKLSIRNKNKVGVVAYRFRKDVSNDQIIELYLKGSSTREIAKLVGMEKTAILGRLHKLQVSLRPSCRDKNYGAERPSSNSIV
jgi:group I intron endonuclease